MQIACNALALCFLGETFDLGICTLQKRIGSYLLGEGKVTEPKNHAVEKDAFGYAKRAAEVPGLHYDSGHHRNQHQEQGAQTSDEKAKHSEGVDEYYVGILIERVIGKDDEKEQYKRHCLPASRKLPYEKIQSEESRVKNRELHPDRQGLPISRREKEICGIKQPRPAHDPAATEKLPLRAGDVRTPG